MHATNHIIANNRISDLQAPKFVEAWPHIEMDESQLRKTTSPH